MSKKSPKKGTYSDKGESKKHEMGESPKKEAKEYKGKGKKGC